METCRCSLRIDYRSVIGSVSSAERSERSHQSLALDVIVKPPLYVLARALPGSNSLPKSSEGLPFGGPYPISLSFHDEVGEAFDAISGELHVSPCLFR